MTVCHRAPRPRCWGHREIALVAATIMRERLGNFAALAEGDLAVGALVHVELARWPRPIGPPLDARPCLLAPGGLAECLATGGKILATCHGLMPTRGAEQ